MSSGTMAPPSEDINGILKSLEHKLVSYEEQQSRQFEEQQTRQSNDSNPEAQTVKHLIADPSGLYHIINWENPRLTSASFVGVMTLFLTAGYLHIMPWILKALCVALGGLTMIKGFGQAMSFKKSAALVPEQSYYTIPEETLNRVFNEIREAAQFTVIQAQKIIFGNNVSTTAIAFAVTFGIFWATKLVSLWWLALIITPIIYLVPLVSKNISKDDMRNLRDQAQTKSSNALSAAGSKASDLQKQAQANSASALNTARDKASNLAGRAQESSVNVANSAGSKASDLKDLAYDKSAYAAGSVQNGASSLKEQVQHTLPNAPSYAQYGASDQEHGVAQRKPYQSYGNGTDAYQSHEKGPDAFHQSNGKTTHGINDTKISPESNITSKHSGIPIGEGNPLGQSLGTPLRSQGGTYPDNSRNF